MAWEWEQNMEACGSRVSQNGQRMCPGGRVETDRDPRKSTMKYIPGRDWSEVVARTRLTKKGDEKRKPCRKMGETA